MGWILRFPTPTGSAGDTDRAELLASALWDAGCTGLFESPDGETVAGFGSEAEAEAAAERVRAVTGDAVAVGIEPAPTAADLAVDEPPVIVRYGSGAGVDRFELTPAGAFGHGAHPTTALVLDLLTTMPTAGARVLDVGTGTGVLAIAAARRGAASVVAVDDDPVAVASARANVAANRTPSPTTAGGAGVGGGPAAMDRITVTDRPVHDLVAVHRPGSAPVPSGHDAGFDLILVNVLLPVHAELGPGLAAALAPGGRVLTAGHLAEQDDRLPACYPNLGPVDRRTSGDWSAFVLAR